MIAVLNEFGFGSLGISEQNLLKDNSITPLNFPPLRINILNTFSGVEFDEAYENKIEEIDDLRVSLIHVHEFIKNKEATGRPKNLGDIASLKNSKK